MGLGLSGKEIILDRQAQIFHSCNPLDALGIAILYLSLVALSGNWFDHPLDIREPSEKAVVHLYFSDNLHTSGLYIQFSLLDDPTTRVADVD